MPNNHNKFGTFSGVFTPDVLTILGVIMYLRLGWVVGNAGLIGAIAIIILAKSITICTGLSMSSITTNIKIGSGGELIQLYQNLWVLKPEVVWASHFIYHRLYQPRFIL